MSHSGGCLCGAVQYEIAGELPAIQVCHCQDCRKASGSAFATNIPVKRDNFTVVRGAEELGAFPSVTRPGKSRVFCQRCGSQLYSQRDDSDEVRVRAGTVNEDIDSGLAFHFFVDSKANGWPLHDELTKYPSQAPGIT